MIRTTRSLTRVGALALVTALFSNIASAASINYGDLNVPPSSMALQVTESSGTDAVPLYGPPQAVVGGLDFDPLAFVAHAVGGAADLTDGQLNFTIMSPGLTGFSLSESGDYSLIGAGTPATQVLAGASVRATITEINGVPSAPIVVGPANASFSDALPGQIVLGPWSLGVGLNIVGALGPGQRATKVDIVINNQLFVGSEPNTAAFIAKKEFQLEWETVPEPTTLSLTGLALCGLAVAGRKRG